MNAQIRQPFQCVGQFLGRKKTPFVPVGDISVLTVDTAERAAGEKDRSGTADTGNRRFFPQVRGNTGNEHLLPQAAETWPDRTVRIALPGTKRTFHSQQ